MRQWCTLLEGAGVSGIQVGAVKNPGGAPVRVLGRSCEGTGTFLRMWKLRPARLEHRLPAFPIVN